MTPFNTENNQAFFQPRNIAEEKVEPNSEQKKLPTQLAASTPTAADQLQKNSAIRKKHYLT